MPRAATATLEMSLVKDTESVKHIPDTLVHSTTRSETSLKNMMEPAINDLPGTT